MNNSKGTIGNRTRNLPVCSAVFQPLRYRMPPVTEQEKDESKKELVGQVLSFLIPHTNEIKKVIDKRYNADSNRTGIR
jgi:hypothetical protein